MEAGSRPSLDEEKRTMGVAIIALWCCVIGTIVILSYFAAWAATWTIDLRRAFGCP